MRHLQKRNKLGRPKDQQVALLRSLSISLFSIVAPGAFLRTTLTKAKVLRPFVEKMITKAKKLVKSADNSAERLHYFRLLRRQLSPEAVYALIDIVKESTLLQERNGGYTRILKLGKRLGDNAEMAAIQIINE